MNLKNDYESYLLFFVDMDINYFSVLIDSRYIFKHLNIDFEYYSIIQLPIFIYISFLFSNCSKDFTFLNFVA